MLNFADTKRKSLERRLTAAVEEWTALTDELTRNRDVVDRLRIQREIKQREADIEEIERDLKELEGHSLEQQAAVSETDAGASPEIVESATRTKSPPASTGMTGVATGLKVFLCHGKEDKAVVRQLYDRLKVDGVDPWLDERSLLPGQNWQREITRAVEASHVVLVCLSKLTTTRAGFIQKEIKLALDVADKKPDGTIFVIPVRFEECEVPERVSDLHWLDYFAADGYERLMLALAHRAREIGVVLRRASAAPAPDPMTVTDPARSGVPSMPPLTVNERDGAELILIPAGEFTMGSDDFDDEKPIRQVSLDVYYIYRTPVTVAQYKLYDRQQTGAKFDWNGRKPGWGWREDHPMIRVTWEEAHNYCLWANGDLPTEAQWEKAARGADGRKYPWGDEWNADLCVNGANSGSGTASVRSKPAGTSLYGVLDMAGNVREWCRDRYDADYYQSAPPRNPSGPEKGDYRVLRGGSWGSYDPNDFRCADRNWSTPDSGGSHVGFRCVVPRTLWPGMADL